MYCPTCGAINRAGARHCIVCGGLIAAQQPLSSTHSVGSSYALPPVAPGNHAKLLMTGGQSYPLAVPLIVIGRDQSLCQIVINGSTISRQHAEIRQQGRDYMLTDLGSHNGTLVNGIKLTGPYTLRAGDLLSFGGGVTCTFQTEHLPFYSPPPAPLVIPQPANSQNPAQPSPMNPIKNQPVTPSPMPGNTHDWYKWLGRPQVRGEVVTTPSEWSDQPPTDFARLLVLFWVIFAFIGTLVSFMAVVVTVGAIVICFGGAALLFIIPFIWMPLQMLFGGLMNWLKDDKPVMLVTFQVRDQQTGVPIDVTFIRKRAHGGKIHLGDKVAVWGQHQGGDSINARKIYVYESQGIARSTNIPIRKPWSWLVGLMPYLATALLVLWLLYGSSV